MNKLNGTFQELSPRNKFIPISKKKNDGKPNTSRSAIESPVFSLRQSQVSNDGLTFGPLKYPPKTLRTVNSS